jgi:hypothetical protein
MDFGNACLFSKKPEDMRRIGALGGRARARNLRFRKARQVSITRECPLAGWGGTLRGTAAEQMSVLPICARMCRVKKTMPHVLRK